MLIEIKGVQFANKGAELMLRAIIDRLAHQLPEAEICLAHNNNASFVQRAKVGAYQKINIRKNILDLNGLFYFFPKFIRQYFKARFGIVTEADVDVILDASGFSYGDQWSDLIMRQVANEVKRVERSGKHYIFMPQSLGPFTRQSNKKYAKQAFQNASLVFAREKPSYEHVSDLLVDTKKLHRAPDFTNLLVPPAYADFEQYRDFLIVIPNSKMLSQRNKDSWWRENYVAVLVKLINTAIEQGEKVIILNHSGQDDAQLCSAIQSQLSECCDIVEPKDAIAVKALIAQGKAIVSSRFHGCVSALSQGIPCIATGWSHKYKELFLEYNAQDMLLNSGVSDEELSQLLKSALNPKAEVNQELHGIANTYKSYSTDMWNKVIAVIKCK